MRKILFVIFLAFSAPALAVAPGEQLPDAAQEARARKLSSELRCLVCQNQSIDDSDAQLARDLRVIVRERIAAGDSDPAIRAFLVERYGEFVLLKPLLSAKTLILWSLPVAALLLGGWGAASLFRRRGQSLEAEQPNAPLSDDEKAALSEILGAKETLGAHGGKPRSR